MRCEFCSDRSSPDLKRDAKVAEEKSIILRKKEQVFQLGLSPDMRLSDAKFGHRRPERVPCFHRKVTSGCQDEPVRIGVLSERLAHVLCEPGWGDGPLALALNDPLSEDRHDLLVIHLVFICTEVGANLLQSQDIDTAVSSGASRGFKSRPVA